MAASGETVNVSRWILPPRAAPSARGSRAIVRRSRHVTARVASRPRSPRGPCRARVGPTARKLKLVEKTIILSVRPDPEPGDLVVLQKADRAISEGHAGGVDGVAIVDLLEVEARVRGVLPEQPIRFLGKVSDLRWQVAIRRPKARRRARSHSLSGSSSVALPAARSARASAASLLSALCEAASWRAQCSSS